MEDKLKALNGITYRDWQHLKIVIDNKFSEIQSKSTLEIDKNALEELKIID